MGNKTPEFQRHTEEVRTAWPCDQRQQKAKALRESYVCMPQGVFSPPAWSIILKKKTLLNYFAVQYPPVGEGEGGGGGKKLIPPTWWEGKVVECVEPRRPQYKVKEVLRYNRNAAAAMVYQKWKLERESHGS